jgi:polyferredoxin
LSLKEIRRRIARPRVLTYAGILGSALILYFGALATRIPIKVDVIHDRSVMGREVEDGMIENAYRMQLMNTEERPRRFRLAVSGIDSLQLASDAEIGVDPVSTRSIPVRVRITQGRGETGTNRIRFELVAVDDPPLHVTEPTIFVIPARRR